jgi:cell division protease FtsH
MSETIGPLSYAGREDHIFLGRDITRSEDFSPETAREIDLEIRRLIGETEQRVVASLTQNRSKLELLAKTLLEVETLTAQQVYALLGMDFTPMAGVVYDASGDGDDGAKPPPIPDETATTTGS